MVLVRKSTKKWRVCIDYTDLNKATPKEYYSLTKIDQLIDATTGWPLSFLDAFSGYNQIKLVEEDQPKTSFITHRAVYAYRIVPMGSMNVGVTYQRAMNQIFIAQIGQNLEIYVDYAIVKSKEKNGHLSDLRETLENLRASKLKLNPLKCGVASSKILGHFISSRGVEVNPDQSKPSWIWDPHHYQANSIPPWVSYVPAELHLQIGWKKHPFLGGAKRNKQNWFRQMDTHLSRVLVVLLGFPSGLVSTENRGTPPLVSSHSQWSC